MPRRFAAEVLLYSSGLKDFIAEVGKYLSPVALEP
jgi:hypothetical protein